MEYLLTLNRGKHIARQLEKGTLIGQSEIDSMTKNIEVVDREGDSDTFKHRIFKVISSGDSDNVDDLRQFLDYPPDHPDHLQDINLEDDSGMSLLMHAAWKGKENSAKFLIQQVTTRLL